MSTASSDVRGVACKLTSLAENDLQVARCYSTPRSALEIRDISKLDWTTFEAYSYLSKDGWELCELPLGTRLPRGNASEYVIDGPKKFWTKAGSKTLNRWYMLCLALSGSHKQPVPHFKSIARYKAIIEGKTFQSAIKAQKMKFDFGDEGFEGDIIADAGSSAAESDQESEDPDIRKTKIMRTEHAAGEDVWGSGRTTFKIPSSGSKFGGWQGSCRCHKLNDKTGCKKFFSIRDSTPEANELALRTARHWINMGPTFQRKRDHGSYNPSGAEVPEASVVSQQRVYEVPAIVLTDVELDAAEAKATKAKAKRSKPSQASSSSGQGR
eukprot:12036348-Alexandrium_andersonii.AAC.1